MCNNINHLPSNTQQPINYDTAIVLAYYLYSDKLSSKKYIIGQHQRVYRKMLLRPEVLEIDTLVFRSNLPRQSDTGTERNNDKWNATKKYRIL